MTAEGHVDLPSVLKSSEVNVVSSGGASGLGKREGPGWWPLLQLLLENHGKNVHIVQKAKYEMRQPGDEVALQDSSVAGRSEARARLSTRMAKASFCLVHLFRAAR